MASINSERSNRGASVFSTTSPQPLMPMLIHIVPTSAHCPIPSSPMYPIASIVPYAVNQMPHMPMSVPINLSIPVQMPMPVQCQSIPQSTLLGNGPFGCPNIGQLQPMPVQMKSPTNKCHDYERVGCAGLHKSRRRSSKSNRRSAEINGKYKMYMPAIAKGQAIVLSSESMERILRTSDSEYRVRNNNQRHQDVRRYEWSDTKSKRKKTEHLQNDLPEDGSLRNIEELFNDTLLKTKPFSRALRKQTQESIDSSKDSDWSTSAFESDFENSIRASIDHGRLCLVTRAAKCNNVEIKLLKTSTSLQNSKESLQQDKLKSRKTKDITRNSASSSILKEKATQYSENGSTDQSCADNFISALELDDEETSTNSDHARTNNKVITPFNSKEISTSQNTSSSSEVTYSEQQQKKNELKTKSSYGATSSPIDENSTCMYRNVNLKCCAGSLRCSQLSNSQRTSEKSTEQTQTFSSKLVEATTFIKPKKPFNISSKIRPKKTLERTKQKPTRSHKPMSQITGAMNVRTSSSSPICKSRKFKMKKESRMAKGKVKNKTDEKKSYNNHYQIIKKEAVTNSKFFNSVRSKWEKSIKSKTFLQATESETSSMSTRADDQKLLTRSARSVKRKLKNSFQLVAKNEMPQVKSSISQKVKISKTNESTNKNDQHANGIDSSLTKLESKQSLDKELILQESNIPVDSKIELTECEMINVIDLMSILAQIKSASLSRSEQESYTSEKSNQEIKKIKKNLSEDEFIKVLDLTSIQVSRNSVASSNSQVAHLLKKYISKTEKITSEEKGQLSRKESELAHMNIVNGDGLKKKLSVDKLSVKESNQNTILEEKQEIIKQSQLVQNEIEENLPVQEEYQQSDKCEVEKTSVDCRREAKLEKCECISIRRNPEACLSERSKTQYFNQKKEGQKKTKKLKLLSTKKPQTDCLFLSSYPSKNLKPNSKCIEKISATRTCCYQNPCKYGCCCKFRRLHIHPNCVCGTQKISCNHYNY